MGIKKVVSGLISFIIVCICFLMFVCILEFFEIVELPENISVVKYLYSDKNVIQEPSIYQLSYQFDSNTVDETIEKVDEQIKNIVVYQKEEAVYDYESLYDEEYLAKLKGNESGTVSSQMSAVETAAVVESGVAVNNTSSNIEVTDAKRFYYSQLPEISKIMYDRLFAHKDDLRNGIYTVEFGLDFDELLHSENGSEELSDNFQLAINALTFDNPELFFLKINKIYLLTEITTYSDNRVEYRVKIGSNNNVSYLNSQFYNLESVNEIVGEIEKIRADIISNAKSKGAVKEQIRFVHDYLVDTIAYDKSLNKDNIYNVYGALGNKLAVCEGYARAFKYIMDEMNIPCIIVCGTAINPSGEIENHAWNYVKVENRWYAIDVTWDDPIILGGGTLTKEVRYSYFLVGRSKLFEDHTEDGFIVGETYAFKYPTLNLTDF